VTYNFKKVKVMVVESSPPMFELVKGVLSLFTVPDTNISSAYSIEEAFQKFCDMQHDILIVDWLQNPDRGIKLTHKIRNDKGTPNRFVPIIMTAGSSHLQKVIRARDVGVSEYLVKPFTAKALAERITRVIESPRLFVSSETYTGPDRRRKTTEEYKGPERREAAAAVTPVQFTGA
jgi:DNA-binding response OmpR family regulator